MAPFADVRDLGGLLQRAQFALPVADADTVTVTYPAPLALMHELRAMGATNVLTARRRLPLRRATLARAIEVYTERFGLADGRVPATFEIITLTGWAPHASQQKPLRPGSAQARLADALGTEELPAGEPAGVQTAGLRRLKFIATGVRGGVYPFRQPKAGHAHEEAEAALRQRQHDRLCARVPVH